MADNTTLPIPSTSGDVIATDDIGGVKFQRVKLTLGNDGVNDGDISATNPVPMGGTILTEMQNLTDSINSLILFLYANTPRRDVANRMAVNNSEVTQPISGSLTTLTTLTNLVNLSGQPVQYLGQGVPTHIYDNIKVT